jgi:hypothetical protein
MIAGHRISGLLGVMAVLLSAPAAAQSARDLLAQGVQKYQDLELDDAAGLLRRALLFERDAALFPADRARALMYLSATEFFRNRRDSATSAVRQLVVLEPRYRPDQLTFPPEVLTLFEQVRRATPAVKAVAARDTSLRLGRERFAVRLYGSGFHEISAALAHQDGRAFRTLYTGPVSDSLDILWDGLDSTGARAEPGRYVMSVTSRDARGREVRMVRIPLEVLVTGRDTLVLPLPPADSLFRPERATMGPALKALAPGLGAGLAVALLPSIGASNEDATGARFVVGGAVTIAGVVGFFRHRPGGAIPENVAHNQVLRDRWSAARDSVLRENANRRGDIRMTIRAGEPQILNLESR